MPRAAIRAGSLAVGGPHLLWALVRWPGTVLLTTIMLVGCAAGVVEPDADHRPTVSDLLAAYAGDDQSVRPGDIVTLHGGGVDPDDADAELSYAWTQLSADPADAPALILLSATAATLTFAVPYFSTETIFYTLQLAVTDTVGARATDTVEITSSVPRPERLEDLGTGEVNVSVIDAEEFAADTHGARITATFEEHTSQATLVRIWGLGNADGYMNHVLRHNDGIFWTATDSSPLYVPTINGWVKEGGRPFTIRAREFATWMNDRNVLFVSSLENPTADADGESLYCDDVPDPDHFIPLCGELDDYIAHSGMGRKNTIFVGSIDTRFGEPAGRAAIRADGVFADDAVYAPALDTSNATAVVAAFATDIAAELAVTYGRLPTSTEIKTELFKQSVLKRMDHHAGVTSDRMVITEERCLRVTGLTEAQLSSLRPCSR